MAGGMITNTLEWSFATWTCNFSLCYLLISELGVLNHLWGDGAPGDDCSHRAEGAHQAVWTWWAGLIVEQIGLGRGGLSGPILFSAGWDKAAQLPSLFSKHASCLVTAKIKVLPRQGLLPGLEVAVKVKSNKASGSPCHWNWEEPSQPPENREVLEQQGKELGLGHEGQTEKWSKHSLTLPNP